jgi:hypothetical protein
MHLIVVVEYTPIIDLHIGPLSSKSVEGRAREYTHEIMSTKHA